MRELAVEFDRDGFLHTQVVREGEIAIYRRERIGGRAEHYEVVRIRVERPVVIKGRGYPERENYPRSEDWGVTGWTFLDIEGAWEKFRQLVRVADSVRLGCGGDSGARAGFVIIPAVDPEDDHTW